MSDEKIQLGLAGEYAVASELCRRGVYTQLTLGNYKRADLLVIGKERNVCRIEVKAKKGPKWANIKGVSDEDAYIVFVDLRKPETERPDFYVLSSEDWRKAALKVVKQKQKNSPQMNVFVDEENCLTFPDQITKSGKPYRGCSISIDNVGEYKDCWDKIIERARVPRES